MVRMLRRSHSWMATTKTDSEGGAKRRVPIRTCVACRRSDGKRTLLRVVRNPQSGLAEFDSTGKRPGRGAYVCAESGCVANAIKRKALERSLKASAVAPELADDLAGACVAEESSQQPTDAIE